jgi:RNase P subunit RPR2
MNACGRAADLKIAFLQTAAQSLAVTSPSTASYLASESLQLRRTSRASKKQLTDKERQTYCTACGNVFVPGLNCSIVRGDKNGSLEGSNQAAHRTVVYYCQACHNSTSFTLPPSPPRPTRFRDKHLSTKDQSAINPPSTDAKSEIRAVSKAQPTKPSSKQRAKARQRRSQLQSLIQHS